MNNPTDKEATAALDEIIPRFPKRWHRQLRRLGLDSFTIFTNGGGEELIYTIKSGNTVLLARCLWLLRTNVSSGPPHLLCNLEVIHTRGSAAIPLA